MDLSSFSTPEKIVKSFSVSSYSSLAAAPVCQQPVFIEDRADRMNAPIPVRKHSDWAESRRKMSDLEMIDDELINLKYKVPHLVTRDEIVHEVFKMPSY